MIREQKTAAVAALRERFAKANLALVATNHGLSVKEATQLRKAVKAAGGEIKVCKHTLTRLAVDGNSWQPLRELLVGPRGLVFAYADPVAVAKVIADFTKDSKALEIEGGVVEGQIIGAEQAKALACMPSLDVLRAGVVRLAAAPGVRVVSMVAVPAQRLAGQIKALVERLDQAEPGESSPA